MSSLFQRGIRFLLSAVIVVAVFQYAHWAVGLFALLMTIRCELQDFALEKDRGILAGILKSLRSSEIMANEIRARAQDDIRRGAKLTDHRIEI